MSGFESGAKREATAEEARALANPLRLRILRLCLDEPRTNKQLADALGRDPGSTLHHVRTLVETGFLEVAEVRTGAKGALEKPYRATGKSWRVHVSDPAMQADRNLAIVDAFRDEVAELPADDVVLLTRFANTLSDEAYEELDRRIRALVDEFALRHDPDGTPYAFLIGGHRR